MIHGQALRKVRILLVGVYLYCTPTRVHDVQNRVAFIPMEPKALSV